MTTMYPKLRSLPIIGNLPDFAKNPLGFLEKLRREHGDVVGFSITSPFVLVSHPDDIEHVLLETGKTFHKGYQRGFALPRVLGNGLVTSEGDFWRKQRKLAQPAFHAKQISSYADIMVEATLDMLRTWQPNQSLDVHHEMMLLTQRIVLKTLFNVDVGLEVNETSKALDTVLIEMERDFTGVEAFLPGFIPTPSRQRLVKALETLNNLLHGIIVQRRQNPGEHHDLLGMLMDARDDDDNGMSDQQLRDELMTLYLAGHETTSNTLSWTWVLLSQHVNVRTKLDAELEKVLGGRNPTLEDLRSLVYTNAVIKEAMRYYPPVWSLSRVASVDTEIGGYAIPKGTEIFLSQWVTHRDERWFENPLEFKPERWLEGPEPLEKRIPKYAYFPFGGGPRICIGNSFSMMESVLLLAEIAQAYRIHVLEPEAIKFDTGATLRPKNGLPAKLEAR
jgi:cytochrome P450